MGLVDSVRGLFSGSKDIQVSKPQINEEYEKSILAEKIVDLVGKIKRINSFDSSIWNLSNASTDQLKRKTLAELQNINNNLNNRLSELNIQSKRKNPNSESLEAAKWTGQRPAYMSDHDFDMYQKGDDGR